MASLLCKPERPTRHSHQSQIAYRSQWKNWGDWLGTGNTKNSLPAIRGSSTIARGLGLRSMAEYYAAARDGCSRRDYQRTRVPHIGNPAGKVGATGWAPRVKAPPKKAKEATIYRSRRLCQISRPSSPKLTGFVGPSPVIGPDDVPANPADSYRKEGWQSWPHFLGTKNKKAGEVVYRDFVSAREWARSQKLKSKSEWKALAASGRLPSDIPASPWACIAIKAGPQLAIGWARVSATRKNRQWRPFLEARDYVRSLGLQRWDGMERTCADPAICLQIFRLIRLEFIRLWAGNHVAIG